jgi:hypothetical protein
MIKKNAYVKFKIFSIIYFVLSIFYYIYLKLAQMPKVYTVNTVYSVLRNFCAEGSQTSSGCK